MKLAQGFAVLLAVTIAACAAPAPRAPVATPIKEIMRLEDQRTIGPNGELLQFLQHEDAAVRARAATAVGRLRTPNGGDATTAKLIAMLDDRDESVRAAAAFALGSRGDVSAGSVLILHATGAKADASALVRARLIEAASKLDEPTLLAQYLTALDDSAAEVRLEAAAGTARWKTDTKSASEINTRVATFVDMEVDMRARNYGLFALERRKAKEGRDVFLRSASAREVDERLFAVRGLANLAGDPAVDEALIIASHDEDWRIAVEALRGLAKASLPGSFSAIAAAIRSSASHHVRATAYEAANARFDAISKDPDQKQDLADLLMTTEEADRSVAVRCAAVSITPRAEFGGLSRFEKTPHERAATIRAWGRPDGWDSLPSYMREVVLVRKDQSLLEREAVVEAIAAWHNDEADARLIQSMSSPDNGIRLAAVTALLEREKPTVPMEDLRQCYATAKGEISTELHFNVLKLAAKIGGDEAVKLLERGMSDEDAYVRRTAHDELEKLTGKTIPWTDKPLPALELAFPGEGLLTELRPHVVIATDRGEMEFVLFADEAPQHVFNFLKHVDFYKGTTFHRVVSDFVAQGGDARGDGNGGSSWRGDALRHEIGPRKYVRGSLGMPRNDDWDSGGSQIFITHRMTPHLDGRYTIFGELVKGFDVLDALDLGDKILEVRVLR